MRAVIQRVSRSRVSVSGEEIASIGRGYMILLGVSQGDTRADMEVLCKKIAQLRIFADDADKMNLSIRDIGGEILLVSQFTLCASTRHGNRPSFVNAMAPTEAKTMYEAFGARLASYGIDVQYGQFGAMMDVELVNDGPVTILLEAQNGVICG